MGRERLVVDERDDRMVVTLDRQATRNAIDSEMVTELHDVCHRLEQDPKPLLLTGGTEIFAGGADIGQLRERRNVDALAGVNSGVFDRIATLPMPTVAAVAGYALGGGAELAYACDFRIGTPSVKLGNPEGGLGILAAAGASWRLIELVGEPLAKEILLAGRTLNADEAREIRLLNEVVDTDDLLPTAHRWIDRMLRNAPLALRMTKLALRMPRSAHPAFDDVAQAVLFETDEKHRRMTAFLDKRKA